jgi:hypothetical protein
VRQHEQQQPDDDVGGAGQADQRPRRQVRQVAQPAVVEVGQQALNDVAQPDHQSHQPGSQRHPAQLLALIGGAHNQRLRLPLVIAGFGLRRQWPAMICHLGQEGQAPAHGASA